MAEFRENSLLDAVMDATSIGSSPRVIHEQHNPNAINWVRGVTDPGEMVACGAYQELRRADGETDETYQKRLVALLAKLPTEHRRKIEEGMVPAALRRASLDTSNGKVSAAFGSAKPAWHGLGVTVEGTMKSADAIRLAGLDWHAEKLPLTYTWNGGTMGQDESFAVVRADTGAFLGTCGNRYTPIQNVHAFDFLDSVISEFGAQYESCGSLFGGEQIWILAHLPRQSFQVNGSTMKAYACFVNYHRQGTAGKVFPTNTRVECANTSRIAMNEAQGTALCIRHTGDVSTKMNDARLALGLTIKGFSEFKDAAEVMHKTPSRGLPYFASDVLDSVLDVTAAQVKVGAGALVDAEILTKAIQVTQADRELREKSWQRKIDRRESILDQILEASAAKDAPAPGTVWSDYNAVTRTATHGKLGKESRDDSLRASRRFESILTGERDQMMQAAYSAAVAMAN